MLFIIWYTKPKIRVSSLFPRFSLHFFAAGTIVPASSSRSFFGHRLFFIAVLVMRRASGNRRRRAKICRLFWSRRRHRRSAGRRCFEHSPGASSGCRLASRAAGGLRRAHPLDRLVAAGGPHPLRRRAAARDFIGRIFGKASAGGLRPARSKFESAASARLSSSRLGSR
jgi:hypothetical protein